MEFERQHMFKRIAKSRINVCDIFRKMLTERRSLRAIKSIINLAIIYVHVFQGVTQPQQQAFNSLQLFYFHNSFLFHSNVATCRGSNNERINIISEAYDHDCIHRIRSNWKNVINLHISYKYSVVLSRSCHYLFTCPILSHHICFMHTKIELLPLRSHYLQEKNVKTF